MTEPGPHPRHPPDAKRMGGLDVAPRRGYSLQHRLVFGVSLWRNAAASLPLFGFCPFVPGQGGRPPPPPELDAVEARIWRAVVDALPASGLIGRRDRLRRLCAQAAILERQEAPSAGTCARRVRISARRPTSSLLRTA